MRKFRGLEVPTEIAVAEDTFKKMLRYCVYAIKNKMCCGDCNLCLFNNSRVKAIELFKEWEKEKGEKE